MAAHKAAQGHTAPNTWRHGVCDGCRVCRRRHRRPHCEPNAGGDARRSTAGPERSCVAAREGRGRHSVTPAVSYVCTDVGQRLVQIWPDWSHTVAHSVYKASSTAILVYLYTARAHKRGRATGTLPSLLRMHSFALRRTSRNQAPLPDDSVPQPRGRCRKQAPGQRIVEMVDCMRARRSQSGQ